MYHAFSTNFNLHSSAVPLLNHCAHLTICPVEPIGVHMGPNGSYPASQAHREKFAMVSWKQNAVYGCTVLHTFSIRCTTAWCPFRVHRTLRLWRLLGHFWPQVTGLLLHCMDRVVPLLGASHAAPMAPSGALAAPGKWPPWTAWCPYWVHRTLTERLNG